MNKPEDLGSSIADVRFPFLARLAVLSALLVVLGCGCSIRKIALTKLGDSLAQSGATFAAEDDPDLVRDAAPFSLKLMESVLSEIPTHRGLLLAASSGFTQYSFAFVQQEADALESQDLAAAEALRKRAARLYLRARNYGLRGLEAKSAGFEQRLRADPQAAVRSLKKETVPFLYWTAVSWAAAISLSKDNPALVADLRMVDALIDRALELDETFGDGAIHTFLITYEMSRSTKPGDPSLRARNHFQRAMDLSAGRQAGPLVALAEAVAIQQQSAKEFEQLLNQALALDIDAAPRFKLVNLIMQRRARWLLSRKDDFFLPADNPK